MFENELHGRNITCFHVHTVVAFSLLNSSVYFETIVVPHALVRNNTERVLVCFAQCPPMAAFCKTVASYPNPLLQRSSV